MGGDRTRRRARAIVATMAVLGSTTLASCTREEPVPVASVVAELEDFKVGLSTRTVTAGHVVIGITNEGPTVHELVVARTDRAADDLPIGPDGLSVAEEARGFRVLGEDEGVRLSEQDVLDLILEPGHYVLFCNLEGHYLGGMYADLDVTR